MKEYRLIGSGVDFDFPLKTFPLLFGVIFLEESVVEWFDGHDLDVCAAHADFSSLTVMFSVKSARVTLLLQIRFIFS